MTTSLQLTAIAGLSYRQVDHWTRMGYLHTIGNPTPGSGGGPAYTREYDDDQVSLACQMSRLVKAGIPMPKAHHVALQILSHGYARIHGYVVAPVHDAHLDPSPLHDLVLRVTTERRVSATEGVA